MPGSLGDVYTFEELYNYYESCREPTTKDEAVAMISNFFFNLGHCCGEGPYRKALQTPRVLFTALAVVAKDDKQT